MQCSISVLSGSLITSGHLSCVCVHARMHAFEHTGRFSVERKWASPGTCDFKIIFSGLLQQLTSQASQGLFFSNHLVYGHWNCLAFVGYILGLTYQARQKWSEVGVASHSYFSPVCKEVPLGQSNSLLEELAPFQNFQEGFKTVLTPKL